MSSSTLDNHHNHQHDELRHSDYCIALYYLYREIPDTAAHVRFQRTELCEPLALTGRIRVATEGLNGVLSGRVADLRAYESQLLQYLAERSCGRSSTNNSSSTLMIQPQASDLDFKYCQLRTDLTVEEQLFPNLLVKETKTVIGLVDTPPPSSLGSTKASRKSKKRQQHTETTKESGDEKDDTRISESAFVRQVYQRAMEQFAKEEAEQLQNKDSSQNTNSVHVPHLSPQEWDDRIQQLSEQPEQSVVFLDCRNVYESNVGHFRAAHTQTLLTNTRKFAELPSVFVQQADRLAQSTHIFAYCTGGVRCERATVFLKELLRETHPERAVPEIYQLKGGIQRYLEQHITASDQHDATSSTSSSCLYKGKNFVFDPRRVDPMVHNGDDSGKDGGNNDDNAVVGRCLVCHEPHDDYDNGHAPALERAARCWNCRVLILVCNKCRPKVSCWGDAHDNDGEMSVDDYLPRMYCGGLEQSCWHRPPVQILDG